jgi:hypothetical protein
MYLPVVFLLIVSLKISLSQSKNLYLDESETKQICGTNNCNAERGVCYMNTCYCLNGFTSVEGRDIYCDYKMKNHYVALLLEFFFPFGAGHFYAENYLLGSLKSAFVLFLIVSVCLFYNYFTGDLTNIKTNKLVYLIITYLFCTAVYLIWNLVDILLFGLNIYKDGNNIKME